MQEKKKAKKGEKEKSEIKNKQKKKRERLIFIYAPPACHRSGPSRHDANMGFAVTRALRSCLLSRGPRPDIMDVPPATTRKAGMLCSWASFSLSHASRMSAKASARP